MAAALVTGASRGIGEAIALRLAGAGWQVFAGVREHADGERLVARDARIEPMELDITNEAHLAALPSRLPERLDAVVNNAGIGVLGPVEAVAPADWRLQFEVNVVGQVAVTQAVLPRLRAARGRIVFISSSGGRAAVPMEGAYCASKFALEGLADALRLELRPWGMRVSVVEPGPTATETWTDVGTLIDDAERRMSPAHRDLYAGHVAGLRKVVGSLDSLSMPPDGVAKVVERALTARHPRARYLIGLPAKSMVAIQAVLPTSVNDAIGARINGLKPLPERTEPSLLP
ncbi:SDR family oxidoreductase [Tessaracoccus terricola]